MKEKKEKKEKSSGGGIRLEGVEIAPGVAETIVSLAAAEVDGVAGVGTAGPISTIIATFNAGKAIPTGGITVSAQDDGKLAVDVSIQAYYGRRLDEVASAVRSSVADALKGQLGLEAVCVDVHVDGLAFE